MTNLERLRKVNVVRKRLCMVTALAAFGMSMSTARADESRPLLDAAALDEGWNGAAGLRAAGPDVTGVDLKAPRDETPPSFYRTFVPAQVFVFGPAPAPRLVLLPCMQIARPADVPVPKPAKGLSLAFDW